MPDSTMLHEVLDTMPFSFFALDRGHRFEMVNKKAEAHFGKEKEWLLGKGLGEVFPEETTTEFYKALGRVAIENGQEEGEYFSHVSHKKTHYQITSSQKGILVYLNEAKGDTPEAVAEVSSLQIGRPNPNPKFVPDATPDSTVAAYHSLVNHNAHRKQTEEALRNSEERFRRLFTNNMVPMFIWAPEGKTLDSNDAFLDLIGYSREELEAGDCDWEKLTPWEGRERDLLAVKEVMEKGFCEPYEKRFRHKAGHLVPFLVGAGVFDSDNFSGVCYAIDLTKRKRAEEALMESEQKFHMLFQSIDEGFCIIEREPTEPIDFRYVEVNEAFANECGINDVVGKTIREIVPEESEEWLETYDRVLRYYEPVRFERNLVTVGRTLELYAFPMRGCKDQVAVIFKDITARKRMHEARYFLASIVESSVDSIVTIDFNRVITSWNKGAERLYGYSANEVIGKPLTMVMLPQDLKQLLYDVDRIMDSKEVKRYETMRIHKDGRLIDLEIELSPVLDEKGDVIGVSTFARDITARKRREANLAFLASLMSDFAPLGTVEEVMKLAGMRLVKHLNLSHCFFVEVDQAASECTVLYHFLPNEKPKVGGTFKLAVFHTEEENQLLASGKPMVVNNVEEGSRTAEQAATYKALDISALINTPHIDKGRWVFDVGIGRSKPCVWQQDEIDLMQEVSSRIWIRMERARAEEALLKSEHQLAEELGDTKKLQEISTRIIEEDNIQALYEAILNSAMSIMNAAFASIQVLSSDKKGLHLLAYANFNPQSAHYWKYVDATSSSSCGIALLAGKRIVVENIEQPPYEMGKGDYEAYRLSGISAVQSTPLISRAGTRMGMISTHWSHPYLPAERELNLLDVLARQTADLIERKMAEDALRESEEKYKNKLEKEVQERTAELAKNLTILKQAEEIGNIGTWEYELTKGIFNWSEGMYHLFELPVGAEVSPEIYFAHAGEKSKSIGEKILRSIKWEFLSF